MTQFSVASLRRGLILVLALQLCPHFFFHEHLKYVSTNYQEVEWITGQSSRVAEQQQWLVGATLLSPGPRWIVRNWGLLVAPSPPATYSATALNFCMKFVPSHTPVKWVLTMFMDTNKGSIYRRHFPYRSYSKWQFPNSITLMLVGLYAHLSLESPKASHMKREFHATT